MRYRRSPRQLGVRAFRKRLRYYVSRLYGARLQKSQRMKFVDFDGCRYKRVILRDSYLAAKIETALESFGASAHLPPLAARYENEIWSEYVPGRALNPRDGADLAALAELFAAFYSRSRPVDLAATQFPYQLWSDLRFLQRVGVIDAPLHAALSRLAERARPARGWVGFDYNDAVSKNFIIRADDGRACAVDVESLQPDMLIGWGLAKAKVRWLGASTDAFLKQVVDAGSPDFREYFHYLELSFLARWTKLGFMERKWKYVQPELLEALAES